MAGDHVGYLGGGQTCARGPGSGTQLAGVSDAAIQGRLRNSQPELQHKDGEDNPGQAGDDREYDRGLQIQLMCQRRPRRSAWTRSCRWRGLGFSRPGTGSQVPRQRVVVVTGNGSSWVADGARFWTLLTGCAAGAGSRRPREAAR